ncbi:MAG: DUF5343 domain-containing protein [Syntrophobacteraceae bacterium]
MAPKEIAKKLIPPYAPYRTFINFLDSLKRGIPQRIDRSLMGSTSGSLQRQLMQALVYLDLIMDDGTPTEKLDHLVHSSGLQKQQTLKNILESGYGFLFKDGIQLDRATASQFRERFEKTGATGDTLRKSMAFFLTAAKAADMGLSPHIKKVPGPRPGSVKPKRILQPKTAPSVSQSAVQEVSSSQQIVVPIVDTALEKMILDKMPDFNPEWSEGAQKSWLDTINKLIDRFQKKSGIF